ncbi:MAG TPA: phospholipase D-like domain-containing protein [Longimicrobiaceae bacterium]|jgi:cardiolipin synthase|nr:phospholipase D-like domain-containing protein [Longimicrobiaceae bacterium]
MPKKERKYRWWMILFFTIGLVTTVGVIVSLFSSLGRRPDRMRATLVPPVNSQAFLDGVSGTVGAPIREGGRAEMLNNGATFFPAVIAEIGRAKRTVDFMVYIWEPGKASDAVFAALTERARAGVQVRLMLDGLGGMKVDDKRLDEFKRAGGRVSTFRPLTFGKLTRFHKRNHRRAIVIDGEVGFTGGEAVADKWMGNADSEEHWRDSMVRVTGPLARSLQDVFSQLWSSNTGEMLVGPQFYPNATAVRPGDYIGHHVNVIGSPGSENHPMRKVFWMSFASARQRLYIASSYFVPDEEARRIVAERARAGVDVRILVPGEKTDAKSIRWAGQGYYDELLSAGAKIYEYQPTMMHAKTVTVDGQWSVVGSANMDVRSDELNQENVLGILDPQFAAQIDSAYMVDLSHAKQINLREWRDRPWYWKVREKAAETLEEQF